MAEYIEREALIAELNNIAIDLLKDKSIQCSLAAGTVVDIKDNVVAKQPTADVVEVKHGEWGKEKWCNTHQHICSNCFATVRVHPESCEYKYCPYCSAKMDGRKEGAE